MPTYKKRPDFLTSEEGISVLEALRAMAADSKYNTAPSYSSNAALYSDGLIPFIDKHMHYLRDHPRIDPRQYISNLRLITRIK